MFRYYLLGTNCIYFYLTTVGRRVHYFYGLIYFVQNTYSLLDYNAFAVVGSCIKLRHVYELLIVILFLHPITVLIFYVIVTELSAMSYTMYSQCQSFLKDILFYLTPKYVLLFNVISVIY